MYPCMSGNSAQITESNAMTDCAALA